MYYYLVTGLDEGKEIYPYMLRCTHKLSESLFNVSNYDKSRHLKEISSDIVIENVINGIQIFDY